MQAFAGDVAVQALVDPQAALVVGADPLAGVQLHLGEAQRQARLVGLAGRLGIRAVAQGDALGVHPQGSAAATGAAGDRCRSRLAGAAPDQAGGANAGDILAGAMAVDGRGAQHQVGQAGFAGGRVVGVEADATVHVDRVAGAENQVFQGRNTRPALAAQQALEHRLVQRQAVRQHAASGRVGQRLAGADIDRTQRQAEIACPVTNVVAKRHRTIGGDTQSALRIEFGVGAARPFRTTSETNR